MKKILLPIFLILAFGTAMFSQNETEETTVEGPKLSLESNTVDYGTIEKNSDPLRSVEFTNTGTEPLIIKTARGNCGCTVPNWPKDPILPGETEKIDIRYATNRTGKINKRVTLTTNETEGQNKHVIRVVGEILKSETSESAPQKEKNMLNSDK